jgi:hypothetical protein
LDFLGIGIYRLAFALEVLLDGVTELAVGDVMRRPGDGGLEAPADFVLTLRAWLEAGDAVLDAELDTLVIARLEVQTVVIRCRSPISSEQRILTAEEYRRGDGRVPVHGKFHHQRILERTCGLCEKRSRQIGLVAVAKKCIPVKSVHRVQCLLVEIASHPRLEVNPGLSYSSPLALGFLAFLGGKGFQVRLEARIPAIGPVKLTVAAHEPVCLLAYGARRLVEEQGMHRREAAVGGVKLDFPQKLRGDGGSIQIGANQQTRSGRGRERYRDREFGVVTTAHAAVGLRPGEIKHELAVGMGFHKSRRGGGEPACIGEGDIGWLPSRASAYAGRMLERCKEFVAQERITISPESIPLPRVELVDAVVKTGAWERLCQECFSMSKASR